MSEKWDMGEVEKDRVFERANAILSGAQYIWDDSYRIRMALLEQMTDQIDGILFSAHHACLLSEWDNAARIYEGVMRASVKQFEFQEEDEFGDLFRRALEGLDECLTQALSPQTRAFVLQSIMTIHHNELSGRGYGLNMWTQPLLKQHLEPWQQRQFATQLEAHVQTIPASEQRAYAVESRQASIDSFQETKDLEDLIDMEIIVDCYDEYEQASGWHHYMMEALDFPFQATLRQKNAPHASRAEHVFEIFELEEFESIDDGLWVLARNPEGDVESLELKSIWPTSPGTTRITAIEAWRHWLNH